MSEQQTPGEAPALEEGEAATPNPEPWRDRAVARLFERVPVSSLNFFRVLFGVILSLRCLNYLGGDLERLYETPVFQFDFVGFAWVPEPSGRALQMIVGAMLASGVCLVVGRLARPAAALSALLAAWILLIDKAVYSDQDYLIVLTAVVLALAPTGRRMRGVEGGMVERWALLLVQGTVALPYVFGAMARLNGDWIMRSQPMASWLGSGRLEGALRFGWFQEPWAAVLFSWTVLLFHLLVLPALFDRRTRTGAFVALVVFHVVDSQLFTPGLISWWMIGAGTIFLPPSWPSRLRQLLGGGPEPSSAGVSRKKRRRRRGGRKPVATVATADSGALGRDQESKSWRTLDGRQKAIALGLAAWFVLHGLLPLRYLLDVGPVDWTERGHTFAWRSQVRDKVGRIEFALIDPVTGDFQPISAIDALLTPHQRRRMLHDPEMVRQFSHYLRERLAAAGRGDSEVRAVTSVSLNGRPQQQIIQPTVDLGRLPADAFAAQWLVPLEPMP